jgi:LAO/AO transport system kinase
MTNKDKKPEWVPENAGAEFTTSIMKGVDSNTSINQNVIKKHDKYSISKLSNGIKNKDITSLAKAITLIESNSTKHINKAQELIKELLPYTGKSLRIGISGAPGVGKSTFIESFGSFLCDEGHKVAVLAIDPSSTRSKGSIMGDKTRMEKLSRQPNAFIRPSPSGGTLGGVARKTRESILLCEAAGFDIILVETVGVGQSEITARSMVDFYMLMILPGGGDELQGIKKGIVELADMLVINKADSENFNTAEITRHAYKDALHYLQQATEGWQTEVLLASAINDSGISEIWENIQKFEQTVKQNGVFEQRRNEQKLEWVYSMVEENLLQKFYTNPEIQKIRKDVDEDVVNGEMTPTSAYKLFIGIMDESAG